MRRCLLSLAMCAAACSYPDFAFEADDTGASGGDTAFDSSSDGAPHDALDAATDGASETLADAPDVPTDETSTDSIVVDDTGSDTGVPPDSGVDFGPDATGPGCAGSSALFCDDYDTSTVPESLFDGTNILGLGKIGIDTSFVHSSPHSFFSTLGSSTATESSATMDKQFTAPTPGALAVLDVWIRVVVVTDPDGIQLFKIQGHGTGKGVALLLGPSGLFVETVGAPGLGTDYPLARDAPTGGFFHYRMQANLVASSAHVTLWIDDMTTPVFDRTDASTAAVAAESNYLIVVGTYCYGAVTTGFSANYDDVTFNFP